MRIKSDKCSKCKVALRSHNHHYCPPCKAEYMRTWRSKHPLSGDSLLRHNANSYVILYVKRGKIIKTPCQGCGSLDVHHYIPDLSKPREVSWLCQPCQEAMELKESSTGNNL